MCGDIDMAGASGEAPGGHSGRYPLAGEESLASAFVRIARQDPGRVFAVYEGEPLTTDELDRRSDALAASLRRFGIAPGARVAVMLRNHLDTVATVFALAKAGLVWVPINVRQRGDSLRSILDNCGPEAVILEADLLATVMASGAALQSARLLLRGADTDEHGLEALLGTGERFAAEETAPDQPLAIMYTSGTTGPPKGVIVTHRMLWLAAEAALLVSDGRDGDVFFVWEPLYHIGGAQLLALPLLRHLRLHMVERFSASRFWRQVQESGATQIHYLGGILQMLLAQPPNALEKAHRVRIAWGAGCTAEVFEQVRERFGIAVRECYGMTEASSITTFSCSDEAGTVGRPVPWFEVEILDPEGRPLSRGERGEIVVRSRIPGAIFPGYFRRPDATEKALRSGCLHTGDVGSLDGQGVLRFHGRLSDSVRCRGENISAWEVEHVVAGHPLVEECAIVGVEAEVGEQDIKLFVRLRDGQAISPEALWNWLSDKLAPYMMPRYIAFTEAFERTGSQRIMKHKLSLSRSDCWDRLAADAIRAKDHA